MKRFQSTLCASALTLAIASTAFAGNISTTAQGNISTTAQGNISTTAQGNISTTAQGNIHGVFARILMLIAGF